MREKGKHRFKKKKTPQDEEGVQVISGQDEVEHAEPARPQPPGEKPSGPELEPAPGPPGPTVPLGGPPDAYAQEPRAPMEMPGPTAQPTPSVPESRRPSKKQPLTPFPEKPAIPPPEARAATQEPAGSQKREKETGKVEPTPQPPPAEFPGMPAGQMPPPGYVFPAPTWYPIPIMPPGIGYGAPYQQPGAYPDMGQVGRRPDPTGHVPVVEPLMAPFVPPPGAPVPAPGFPTAPYAPQGYPPPQLASLEDEEFQRLTRLEPSHWRGDLKWIFGILTALFLFATIAAAGLYRSTGSGAAKQILVPLIERSTEVKEAVEDNYKDLRSRARKSSPGTSIFIPDVGVYVSVKASDINSLSSNDLADRVILEVERQVYSQGNSGDVPLSSARGVGEERAKAFTATLLSSINQRNHNMLFWPLLIFGVLTVVFGVLFLLFCRGGWGKVLGLSIAIIAASLPASLLIRVSSEFIWLPDATGLYRGGMSQAFRTIGSLSVVFFDVALGIGALLLLIGVIGSTISRKSRERVPPFRELKSPEEAIVGGPPLEPGLEPVESGLEEDYDFEAFKDLEPPRDEPMTNP